MSALKPNLKSLILCLVLLGLIAGVMYFLTTDLGQDALEWVWEELPFRNLLQAVLEDIHKMLGMAFAGEVPKDALTLPKIFTDFCKVMLTGTGRAFLCNIVFVLFGMQSGDLIQAQLLNADPFYHIARCLLSGIAFVISSILSNLAISVVYKAILTFGWQEQNWISCGIFLLVLLFCSLYYMVFSLKHSIFTTFRLSIVKTLGFNIMPEAIGTFIGTGILVYIFEMCRSDPGGYRMFLGILLLVAWSAVLELVLGKIQSIISGMMLVPYLGQSHPFSAPFWLIGTITWYAMLMLAVAINYSSMGGDPLADSMVNFPFMSQYAQGIPWNRYLFESPVSFASQWLYLVVLCGIAALLQYLTSTSIVTIWTQVVGRAAIILGVMFVILALVHMVISLVWPNVLAAFGEYLAVLFFIGLLLFLLVFCLQPVLMVQAVLSSVGIIALMYFFPCANFNIAAGEAQLMSFFGVFFVLLGVHLLASLIQNLICCFTQFFPKI